MRRRRTAPPAYRRRVINGRAVAYVTLSDWETHKRRDIRLGDYGSAISRQLYSRLLTEWEANDRRLTIAPRNRPEPSIRDGELRICELALSYYNWAQGQVDGGDLRSLKAAIRVLNQLYGESPAVEFGPNALRTVRKAMVRGDAELNPPRRPWTRGYCQSQTRRLVAMFAWAVGREIIPATHVEALRELEPLRAGRGDAIERTAIEAPDVECAPMLAVEAVMALANTQIRAMIEVQLATGMRPGELCIMRPCDLDRSGEVWLYRPTSHKTAHRGKRRIICLGPRAQRALRPLLDGRGPSVPVFSPAEAEAERKAAMRAARKSKVQPSQVDRRLPAPAKRPGNAYTPDSYRRAVVRLCDDADAAARAQAQRMRADCQIPPGMRFVPRWHPHQLRHSAATEFRRQHGLEAAQLMLGHSSALVTDAVYAERDLAAMRKIAAQVG